MIRQVRRRLFDAVSAFSMLLFGATAILWIGSFAQVDVVYIFWHPVVHHIPPDPDGTVYADVVWHYALTLKSVRGVVAIETGIGDRMKRHHKFKMICKNWGPDPSDRLALLQMEIAPALHGFPVLPILSVSMSDAIPLACFSILPAIWWRRVRRAKRRARRIASGHCHSCGYDLRESKDRCPECGNARITIS